MVGDRFRDKVLIEKRGETTILAHWVVDGYGEDHGAG